MSLKVKTLYLIAGRPIAILHEETAKKYNLHAGDRIRLKNRGKTIVAPIDITGGTTILTKNEIALSKEITDELKLKKNASIEISAALKPLSVNYISKKLHDKELSYTEIYSIVSAIVNNELTEAEVAYFVSGVYLCGMSLDEIVSLTRAMVRTGQRLDLRNKIIIDKHSIGGVAGNRTTPIVTSIIGAFIDKYKLDAVMPKTSSRAITSAAGTADVIETIAKVEFSVPEVKKILQKASACLVWGGSLGFAPADDKIIHAERILNLDPEAQLIASILSKKLAVNATHILIDIAYGKSAKVKTISDAIDLKKRFESVAKHFNLNLRCLTTKGDQPIGNGIGPALEIRDILAVLQREETRPVDLEKKSLYLASELLSFVTKMPKKEAYNDAKLLLESGEAFKKFKQIIEAQGGSLSNLDKKLKLASFKTEIGARKTGKIIEIDNKKIASITRIIGCPADTGAGIFLHKHAGDPVKKNEPLFTIYAETKDKLNYARHISERIMPVTTA